jgi:hypothetical protein
MAEFPPLRSPCCLLLPNLSTIHRSGACRGSCRRVSFGPNISCAVKRFSSPAQQRTYLWVGQRDRPRCTEPQGKAMSRRASPFVSDILGNVCGLPGITIFALLASVAMGLAVPQANIHKARPAEAAIPAGVLMLPDSPGSRFSPITAATRIQPAKVRSRILPCPLPVMSETSRCD